MNKGKESQRMNRVSFRPSHAGTLTCMNPQYTPHTCKYEKRKRNKIIWLRSWKPLYLQFNNTCLEHRSTKDNIHVAYTRNKQIFSQAIAVSIHLQCPALRFLKIFPLNFRSSLSNALCSPRIPPASTD